MIGDRGLTLTRRVTCLSLISQGEVLVPGRVEAKPSRVVPLDLKGDEQTDQRELIQSEIDKLANSGGGTLLLPNGVFMLGVVQGKKMRGMAGCASLFLRTGVSLIGSGRTCLRTMPMAYGSGAYYRMLAAELPGVSDVLVQNVTLDGNRSRQIPSIQASNMVVECISDIIVDRVHSVNANGNGMMLRGQIGSPAVAIIIKDCSVEDASAIGIQVSQFNGLQIVNNAVSRTGDNGIDIYGENGTVVSSGSKFEISGNKISDAQVGVFVETCRIGVVRNNTVMNGRLAGIAVNRIHGRPESIIVDNNGVVAVLGVRISGDTGGVAVTNNKIAGFSVAGIEVGMATGRASNVTVAGNIFGASMNNSPAILTLGDQVVNVSARNNCYEASFKPPIALLARRQINVSSPFLERCTR